MVARQVGEHGGVKGHAVHAVLRQAVAGHFHGDAARALLFELADECLHGNGVGRGVRGGLQRAKKAVAHRADDGAAWGVFQIVNRLGKPLGDGGFAVGACYADDFQAARKVAIGLRRHHARTLF